MDRHAAPPMTAPQVGVTGARVPSTPEPLDPVFTVSGLTVHYGDYAAVRRQEVAAALNRLRTLKIRKQC